MIGHVDHSLLVGGSLVIDIDCIVGGKRVGNGSFYVSGEVVVAIG